MQVERLSGSGPTLLRQPQYRTGQPLSAELNTSSMYVHGLTLILPCHTCEEYEMKDKHGQEGSGETSYFLFVINGKMLK